MLSTDVMTKLESMIQQVAQDQGCELYDIEFAGVGGRRTLRIYIDRPEGVGIADCSSVSRGLSELLDVDDPIEGAYDLEVSTPGIERVLRKPWHFQRVIGKKIQTRLLKPLEAYGVQNKKFSVMKQVSETLAAADEEGIEFRLEEEVAKIPFSAIDRAKVLFETEAKGEKKTEKKKKKK